MYDICAMESFSKYDLGEGIKIEINKIVFYSKMYFTSKI